MEEHVQTEHGAVHARKEAESVVYSDFATIEPAVAAIMDAVTRAQTDRARAATVCR